MPLPVDLSAVLKAATNIEEAAKTPLSVTVVVDGSAPGDLVGHVRQAFASAGAHTRVTILYLDEHPVDASADDMAVIAAGVSESVGEQAAKMRNAGVPVMVATTMPKLVADMAAAQGFPIPDGDVVSPVEEEGLLRRFSSLRGGGQKAAEKDAAAAAEELGADEEPIVLDDARAKMLDANMGRWIIAACAGRKLAFALAFPFVRRPLSMDAINATSLQNAAVGFVPFIPGADMPIMTLNQAKMLMEIAAAYGQPLDKSRIKELAALVAGAFALRGVARSVAKLVPGIGWVVSGAVGFTGTEAMGRAAIDYFEAGGDMKGLANVVQQARDEAVDAAKKAADTPVGQKVGDLLKSGAGTAFRAVTKRA